ncbi:hypothetical protein M569_04416 [Genlisea aurea]|uniref:Peroxisomal membrane protein PEX16 n=1 Tax=Genlisea aurea TaxID=192259 RepID=S8CSX2_9LAMI|nr:hypothetical protein M569_04416 [Genlisea aurea]
MEAYKRWLLRNRDYVHSLNSLANGLTWLLPERFSDSEIGPEAVTSILGIITSVNEHILDMAPTRSRLSESSSSTFSLYITLLKDLETLIEVAAQHYFGEEKKWNCIAMIEAAKVYLRLSVLRRSGYKMLLHGGENTNDDDLDCSKSDFPSKSRYPGIPDALRNHPEAMALSALSKFGENARNTPEPPTWLRRVQRQQVITESPPAHMNPKTSLSSFLSERGIPGGLFLTAEAISILRPLIYVMLIRKYGVMSWFPWFTSFALDIVGTGINSYVSDTRTNLRTPDLSDNEKNELKRRKLLWALYLMRDPFFAKYTRRRLDVVRNTFEPVPIVGLLAEKVVEFLVGAQTRYTYMSGS